MTKSSQTNKLLNCVQALLHLQGLRFSLLVSFCILTSCGQKEVKNLRPYYFPYEQLEDGLVYEYRSLDQDSLAPYYKYYISIENDTSRFLASNYYDHFYRNTQFSLEEIIPEGAILKEYHFMDYDSLGKLSKKIKADIKSSSLMAFEWGDEEGYLASEIEFKDFRDSLLVNNLSRQRRYLKDTTYQVLGKERDCAVFSVKEIISYNNQGEYLEYDSNTLEFYAKGIGLVYFHKNIQNNIIQEFKLTRQFPMDTLVKMSGITPPSEF